jgi:putative zinc finger/helix-turn-helix YgiT family protein
MTTTVTEFCVVCAADRRIRREQQQVEYDVRGAKISLAIPVKVCEKCGTSEVDETYGRDPVEAAYGAYRERNNLLNPEQIREIRKKYHLSQKTFAAILGMSEATINRYEGGGLQDAAHDATIRACQSPEFVRQQLQLRGDGLSARQRSKVEAAIQRALSGRRGIVPNRERLSTTSGKPSLTTGFRQFDYERYAAVVVWFCRNVKTVTATSLNRLLFYADFLCYKTETRSITGAAYRRMTYGPVPADYGVLRERMEMDGYVRIEEVKYKTGFVGEQYYVGPMADSLGVLLSPREIRVLETVAQSVAGLTPREISDRSHQESAWIATPDRQLISYREAASLSLTLPG